MPLPPAEEFYDLAPCGLLSLDAELTIRSANAYFLQMVGLADGALADGLKFTALLSVASRIFVQGRLQAQLALAGRVEEIALDLARSDGRRVPVMINAAQARDAHGRPGAIHMAISQAVATRAYEAEVPKARQEALSALRVKADFLANISHEIRTPLNGVIGVVGALGRTVLSPQQREMVALIEASAVTLERLVGDILEISRVEASGLALSIGAFRPDEELRGVLDLAALNARAKGLAFEVVSGPGLDRTFLGDGVRLRQILTNLTSNAIKFTEQGVVRVELTVEIAEDAPTLVLSVRDTGIGFDPHQADALFEPFHQVDAGISRRVGGVGLGLSISKALVEAMGGSISARSAIGEGSAFTARIPVQAVDDPAASDRPETPADLERALRVLLVEDNEINQRVVQMILEQAEIDLTIAANGALGLDAWRGQDFDLVLMDMQMPVMDGLTAIRAMRAEEASGLQGRRTPIAVLSANAMEHHRAEALEAGADSHIAKPISAAALLNGIQKTLSSQFRD
ncbi:ATP-binding protein [Caulobacter sp. CCNWLY153]|uniref:histidine kinase n=2 Tax=Caulobacter TaxID=75 RepID=A0A2T9JIJ1_9CAUL|nr:MULTISPECIES: ATP-binding protein [Caulobacter]NGM49357.1 response regulator [Caulobacter sp. 602-2]PVM79424.1 hybrid sensor histidine kinase/response regulator [Caulobacter radicis]PVM83517.1 hybrid sensor histidine kinase/response regulator [Caulobacter radicis]